MLTLPCSLIFTPSQFAEVCAANPEAVLELAADGTLIGMTPTGGNKGTHLRSAYWLSSKTRQQSPISAGSGSPALAASRLPRAPYAVPMPTWYGWSAGKP